MADNAPDTPNVHQVLMVQILADFAKLVGLDDLTPDTSGYCALEGEGDRVIHLQREDTGLLLMTELGSLPTGDDRLDVLEALLAANLFWQDTRGATVSLDPMADKALLAWRIPLDQVAKDGLHSVLETLLAGADNCREHLTPKQSDGDPSLHDQLV